MRVAQEENLDAYSALLSVKKSLFVYLHSFKTERINFSEGYTNNLRPVLYKQDVTELMVSTYSARYPKSIGKFP